MFFVPALITLLSKSPGMMPEPTVRGHGGREGGKEEGSPSACPRKLNGSTRPGGKRREGRRAGVVSMG